MYPASTGNISHFLFSDLKPAVWVHSVKLMDWIDSQQWLLQLEDESPYHFLSFFPLVSLFFCFPPSVARSFFLKKTFLLSTPTSTRTYHPSLQFSPSAVPSSQHLINICLGFRPCQLAGICTLTRARSRSPVCRLERSGKQNDRRNGTSPPPQSCFYVCK